MLARFISKVPGVLKGMSEGETYKNRETADAEQPTAHDRYDPMDSGTCAPSEYKKAYWDQPATRHKRDEPLFWLAAAIAIEILRLGQAEPHSKNQKGKDCTAQKSKICESYLALIEAVYSCKDNGKDFQPSEDQHTDQGCVRVEEETDWFLKAKNPWPGNCLIQQSSSSDVQGSELGLRSERGILRILAYPLGSPVKDVRGTGLR